MVDEKGPGRGRGRFTAPGAQADQEARLAAIENYLGGLIDAGTLPEPETSDSEVAPEGGAEA